MTNQYWTNLCKKAGIIDNSSPKHSKCENIKCKQYFMRGYGDYNCKDNTNCPLIVYPPETAEKILGLMKLLMAIGFLKGFDTMSIGYCVQILIVEIREIIRIYGSSYEQALCTLITQPEVWEQLDVEEVRAVFG